MGGADLKGQTVICIWIVQYDWAALISQGGGGGSLVTKSCLTLATLWTVAHQSPLSMGFFRQEYWSGLTFLSPGHESEK